MPIAKGNTNLSLAIGSNPISAVYKGTTLVYSAGTWEDWYNSFIYYALVPSTINSKSVQKKSRLGYIEGNSVVDNQLNDHATRNYTNDNPSIYTSTKTDTGVDLVCTTSGSATNKILTNLDLIVGHKYIAVYDILSTLSFNLDTSSTLSGSNVVYNVSSITANQQTKVVFMIDASGSTTVWRIARGSTSWTTGATMSITNIMIFDLTQMFPISTPTTITDTRIQALLNRGYIPYNTGEIKCSSVGAISSYGYNIFDGSLYDGYIDNTDGSLKNSSGNTRTSYIQVIPSRSYVFGNENFTTSNGRRVFEYDKDKNFIKHTDHWGTTTDTISLTNNTLYSYSM